MLRFCSWPAVTQTERQKLSKLVAVKSPTGLPHKVAVAVINFLAVYTIMRLSSAYCFSDKAVHKLLPISRVGAS